MVFNRMKLPVYIFTHIFKVIMNNKLFSWKDIYELFLW